MTLLRRYIEDKYTPKKNSVLSFNIFIGISVSSTALLDFNFIWILNFFKSSILSTGEK